MIDCKKLKKLSILVLLFFSVDQFVHAMQDPVSQILKNKLKTLYGNLFTLQNKLGKLKERLTALDKALHAKPIARHMTTVSIATCNVLGQIPYVKFAKPDTIQIGLPQRRASLKNSFQVQNQFNDTDILCFQEWDLGDQETKQLMQNYGYSHRYLKYSTGFLVVAWKRSRFVFVKDYNYITTIPSVNALGVVLRSDNELLYIVSLHAKGGKEASPMAEFEVIRSHADKLKNISATFVCGDFNYNGYNDFKGNFTVMQRSLAFLSWENVHKTPNVVTARGSSPTGDYPALFDYILYHSDHKIVSFEPTIFPTYKQFISHKEKVVTDYFSDHAIVRSIFEIEQTRRLIKDILVSSCSQYAYHDNLRWLKIPSEKDAVLIELDAEQSKPTIDAATDPALPANFRYVDPSYYHITSASYHTLPPGLFHWLSDVGHQDGKKKYTCRQSPGTTAHTQGFNQYQAMSGQPWVSVNRQPSDLLQLIE